MSDIVERLRACALDKDNFPNMRTERKLSVGDALEAADEIERLSAALREIADIYARGAVRIGADVDVPRIARAALEGPSNLPGPGGRERQ